MYHLGRLETSDWRISDGLRLPPHEHEGLHACVVLDGGFAEHSRRSSTTCAQTTVRLSPPGASHDIRFAPLGARCVVLHFSADRDELWSLVPPRDLFVQDHALSASVTRLLSDLAAGDDLAPMIAECAALELFAQVMRRAVLRRPGDVPAWLRRVRDRLHDDVRGALDLEALASSAGVHRVTLARAFREHFGSSVGDYLRRLRLEHARRLITQTVRPLSHIAAEAGFADQSHLTRHLKRSFGVTPFALRAACRD